MEEQSKSDFEVRATEGEPETFEPDVEVAQTEAEEQNSVWGQVEMARQLGLPQELQDKLIAQAESSAQEVGEKYKQAITAADNVLFALISYPDSAAHITYLEGIDPKMIKDAIMTRISEPINGNELGARPEKVFNYKGKEYHIRFAKGQDSPGSKEYDALKMEKIDKSGSF